MVDRDPEPEGFESRCAYCGKPLVIEEVESDVVMPTGRHRPALHFCGETCEALYRPLTDEERKQMEDLHRSGAT